MTISLPTGSRYYLNWSFVQSAAPIGEIVTVLPGNFVYEQTISLSQRPSGDFLAGFGIGQPGSSRVDAPATALGQAANSLASVLSARTTEASITARWTLRRAHAVAIGLELCSA